VISGYELDHGLGDLRVLMLHICHFRDTCWNRVTSDGSCAGLESPHFQEVSP